MEEKSRYIKIYLGDVLKEKWLNYCDQTGKKPGTAIKEEIARKLSAADNQQKVFSQKPDTPDEEPKIRFEILLTPSEKKAIEERAALENCSQRRWIIDAIRAGLTGEPQFNMEEIEALGESNYQLLAIGRNLNQIARHLNAEQKESDPGKPPEEPITLLEIKRLKDKIDTHVNKVSNAIRASLERWEIEI